MLSRVFCYPWVCIYFHWSDIVQNGDNTLHDIMALWHLKSVRIPHIFNKSFPMSLYDFHLTSWWCHDIEMVYALLALCEGNPPQVAGWFPLRSTSNTSFGISFLVELNTLFNKQSSCQWSETPWHSCDFIVMLPSHLDQSCGPPLVGPWLTTCIHMDNQEFPAHNGTHYSPLSSQYPTNYRNTSNRRLTEISLLSSHI